LPGWILLLGPVAIILFLIFFGDMPWVARQSEQGALVEADKFLSYGRDLMKEGRLQEAYAAFQRAQQIKPDHAVTLVLIGQTLYAAGDIHSAEFYLKRALALDPPQKDQVYNNLGILYAKRGNVDSALVNFQRALDSGVETANIYENIAYLYKAIGNYPRALEAFRKVVEHLPDTKSLYLEMLRTALTDYYGKPDKAADVEVIRATLARGVSNEELAVYDAAIVNQRVRMTAKNAERLKNLGEMYQIFGDVDAAERCYHTALELYPTYAPAYLQLGLLYRARGEFEPARRALETALKLRPNYPEAQQALADLTTSAK
jgi:tetratricopeptide (TPR) repeat protein